MYPLSHQLAVLGVGASRTSRKECDMTHQMEEINEENRADLLRTLENAFSTSYVTLISIIQGAALGYLGSKLDSLLSATSGVYEWLLSACILLIIVGVWNEYLMGVTLFN
jgi:hypothetical protein